MIEMNSHDYEVYTRYYRRYRGIAQPETLRDAFGTNNEQMHYFENIYQREIHGEPMGIMNVSRGVAVLEL